MGNRYAYCPKCDTNRKIEYSGVIDGDREKVKCVPKGHTFWIMT